MNGEPAGKDPSKIAERAEWLEALLGGRTDPSKEIWDAATQEGFAFDNATKGRANRKEESGLHNSNLGQIGGVGGVGIRRSAEMEAPTPTPLPRYATLATLRVVILLDV